MIDPTPMELPTQSQPEDVLRSLRQEVAERQRAEAALQASEANFRAFFNTVQDILLVATPEGSILFANDALERLLGYGPDEQRNMHLLDLHPPDRRGEAEAIFGAMLQGERLHCPLPLMKKSGDLLPVETRAWLGQWSGTDCVFGLVKDMSAAREAEQRFESIFQSNPSLMALSNLEGQFTHVNDTFLRKLGYTREEVLGRTSQDLDLFPEPERQAAAGALLAEQGRLVDLPLRVRRKDGGLLHGLFSGRVIQSAGQSFFLTVMADITELVDATNALRESEGRARALLDALPDMMFRLNREGVFIDYQAEDDDMLVSGPGLIGRRVDDIFPPEFAARTLQRLDETLVSGRLTVFEYQLPMPEKGLCDFEARMVVSGRDEVTAVVRDITERKRAEESRARLEEQLRQAQKMESVGRLAGGVAHDFNNMLGVILGRAEMALAQVAPEDDIHLDLEEIRKAASRSASLTRQLLAFARRQTMEERVLDLNEITVDILKMLRRLVGENITVSLQQQEDLWSVKADPSLIDQIMTNLCVNSRAAIEDIGHITIETANCVLDEAFCAQHPECAPGEYGRLSVCDDGHGMDAATMEHIFEPFFTTKDIGEGTGLGLATVYGAVRQSNGCITVESVKGQGTMFRVYLPRHLGDPGQAARGDAPHQTVARGRTVLVVEDEPLLMSLCRELLSRCGYTVLTADTPHEALLLAASHAGDIHLLMTDVVMPGMNGRELARELQAKRPELEVLFMSGYTADVIGRHGVLEQGENFLQKPFTLDGLRRKLSEVLRQDATSA
jgi:PAS domain S-box-containing protein